MPFEFSKPIVLTFVQPTTVPNGFGTGLGLPQTRPDQALLDSIRRSDEESYERFMMDTGSGNLG